MAIELTDDGMTDPGYYGNLARVAIHFYIQTGNSAELHAAYWYARYAVNAARAVNSDSRGR